MADAYRDVYANGEVGSRDLSIINTTTTATDTTIATDTIDSDNKVDYYPVSDVGIAEHFATDYGHKIQYIPQWRCWLYYNGKVWKRDTANRVGRLAVKHVRFNMPRYAATIADAEQRTKYLKWCGQCQSQGKIDAMVALALLALSNDATDLDANPNLLNVRNGTIELDTLTFRPHSAEDNLTKICNANYDPAADAPRWHQFINRIFQAANGTPRGDIIAYVQRAIGYCMTADVSEQCLFVLYGGGRNGKTTFIETLKTILGDYALTGQQTLLMRLSEYTSRNSDDEAELFGRRLVCVSEIEQGQRMDESKVKRIVGGGEIRAMRKYEQSFAFLPTHKVWLDCNHKPRIKGEDEGIWRRIKLIEFLVQIPYSERDLQLADKLQTESSGILNWMLQGVAEWRTNGLAEPRAVASATGNYRTESDTLGRFSPIAYPPMMPRQPQSMTYIWRIAGGHRKMD